MSTPLREKIMPVPPVPSVPPARSYSPISGPKILSYGYPGSGKTHALLTLLEINPSIEVFCILTDQCAPTVLNSAPAERLHWNFINPSVGTWTSLIEVAKIVNTLSYESIAEMKMGIDKKKHTQWMDMLQVCYNFVDQRTGREYGPIDEFPTNYIIVFDGLTGLSTMARGLTVGAKPNPHQGEWGSAMSMIEGFITMITQSLWQWVIIIAHTDRTVDEVLATSVTTCATLGNKLAPKLPGLFTDVIVNSRKGREFTWSNALPGFITKKQHLDFGDTHKPSYVPLAQEWQRRGGLWLPAKGD